MCDEILGCMAAVFLFLFFFLDYRHSVNYFILSSKIYEITLFGQNIHIKIFFSYIISAVAWNMFIGSH